MKDCGINERHTLPMMAMSANALRYQPAPDRNQDLRGAQIVTLAQRHQRYRAEMIYVKVRPVGNKNNHEGVDGLLVFERPQLRRRRRKIPPGDRQPWFWLGVVNEVCSMDFVFDRAASGRPLKCFAIVDDTTHEAVAVISKHAIGAEHPTRRLEEVCARQGRDELMPTPDAKQLANKLITINARFQTQRLLKQRDVRS